MPVTGIDWVVPIVVMTVRSFVVAAVGGAATVVVVVVVAAAAAIAIAASLIRKDWSVIVV